jgi:hypothetical protein
LYSFCVSAESAEELVEVWCRRRAEERCWRSSEEVWELGETGKRYRRKRRRRSEKGWGWDNRCRRKRRRRRRRRVDRRRRSRKLVVVIITEGVPGKLRSSLLLRKKQGVMAWVPGKLWSS